MAVIDLIVLGMYVPIVIFSGAAAAMFWMRLIWPALREQRLEIGKYAIGISATCALAAHALENSFYGILRWNSHWREWADFLPLVGIWKVLILASSVFAVAALRQEATTHKSLVQLCALVLAFWVLGTVLAAVFVV